MCIIQSKFAFGFFKSNMNFSGPKDTKMYLFFSPATQYILTEIWKDRTSFPVQMISPDRSVVSHVFAFPCEKPGTNE